MEKLTPVYDVWRKDGVVRNPDEVIQRAHDAGVSRMVCIATSVEDSQLAVEFVEHRDNVWAAIGIHPHEAQRYIGQDDLLDTLAGLVARPGVVAVGECGLDYFYNHSPREAQIEILRFQIELALLHDLPLSFHVREAYDDFWPIFEEYKGIRGVLHSFTDNKANMDRAIGHGLYIGMNGIATFAKDEAQIAMYQAIPLQNLVLETDAPFLTPTPFRGTICEPYHTAAVAEFGAKSRGLTLDEFAAITTANARKLFGV
ncbi:TatD family hydrolase [Aeromicrobium sp.]|nr:TatD family hydrolase [Candidatus Saccharibacteria bacterium]